MTDDVCILTTGLANVPPVLSRFECWRDTDDLGALHDGVLPQLKFWLEVRGSKGLPKPNMKPKEKKTKGSSGESVHNEV